MLSLIVAVGENGVIGRADGLPWRQAGDLKRFRKLTMGSPMIMGRKTFEAIGRPLDGRDSIVVSRRGVTAPESPGVFVASSLEEALSIARRQAAARGATEAFVIGGAQLFEAALAHADRVYLTRIHASPEGDVFWEPPFGADWKEVHRQDYPASERDEHPVTDIVMERSKAA